MRLFIPFLCLLVLVAQLHGCASDRAIPKELEEQVDQGVTFDDLKASPSSYRGSLVVLGGEVLTAKRLKQGTQIEVLQLPLDRTMRPNGERTASQGRFLAVEPEFLDPATLTEGTPITVVGEVTGAETQRLDEVDYTYPTLRVRHLKVWERSQDYPVGPSGPRFGIFGGTGIGFGGRRRSGGGVGVGVGF